jgi:hypothetical protein
MAKSFNKLQHSKILCKGILIYSLSSHDDETANTTSLANGYQGELFLADGRNLLSGI